MNKEIEKDCIYYEEPNKCVNYYGELECVGCEDYTK